MKIISMSTPSSFRVKAEECQFISVAFSCILLGFRIIASGHSHYLFLAWNLFLGSISYIITFLLLERANIFNKKWKQLIAIGIWLIFLPNSFYIVTDLFHLDRFGDMPQWFDLLLLFSFAWNGIVFGVLSLRRMEIYFLMKFAWRLSIPMLFALMWINSFGVYLGRYLRFNSWDLLAQPLSLLTETTSILIHPSRNLAEWGMISIFAIFTTLLYVTMKNISGNFDRSVLSVERS